MTCQATNAAGTMWAGAWNQKVDEDSKEAVHVIDLNGFAARNFDLGKNADVQCLSWADDNTVRVVCAKSANEMQVVYLNGETGKKMRTEPLASAMTYVLSWPGGSKNLAAVKENTATGAKLAALDESGKQIGKEISLELPKEARLDKGYGLADDASSFVFSVSDPAANDGKAFYVADTKTGMARKAWELGDLPGRIEGLWCSDAGVLMVCRVKQKLEDMVWDPASGKLAVRPDGVDVAKWPGVRKAIGFTTFDGGYEFDLASGKVETVFDSSKKSSDGDRSWRNFLRDSRLYKLKSGNYITISETGGVVDIRELKPDGKPVRALLSRI